MHRFLRETSCGNAILREILAGKSCGKILREILCVGMYLSGNVAVQVHRSCQSYDSVEFMSTFNYFYRPPTKLLESSVFSRVCSSICSQGGGGGSHVTIIHNTLDLIVHQPSPTSPGPTPFPSASARCQNIQILSSHNQRSSTRKISRNLDKATFLPSVQRRH